MSRKKKKQQYFRGDVWFDRQVESRTRAALSKVHRDFVQEHREDTEAQLLEYVRQCALQLGHTPSPVEIIGSEYIISRIGDWARVITAAGLPSVNIETGIRCKNVYKQEYKKQAKQFKAERAARKAERAQKSALGQAEVERLIERDMTWGNAHDSDTDEQLLEYVRQCAADLGHTPLSKEVLGARYISQRFGSWAVVLYFAELPLRHGMEPPKQAAIDRYMRAKAQQKH